MKDLRNERSVDFNTVIVGKMLQFRDIVAHESGGEAYRPLAFLNGQHDEFEATCRTPSKIPFLILEAEIAL